MIVSVKKLVQVIEPTEKKSQTARPATRPRGGIFQMFFRISCKVFLLNEANTLSVSTPVLSMARMTLSSSFEDKGL
jgi:hypothetical protein